MKKEKSFADRRKEFAQWHKDNSLIWDYFEQFSIEAVTSGKKRISHWLIINRIRWEVYIVTTGADYKISNGLIAFYARLWRETYPQHKNLFKIKRMKGEPWFDDLDE